MKTNLGHPCLETFLSAYLATALWSSTDDAGDPIDSNFSKSDVASSAMERAKADCARFLEANGETIDTAIVTGEVICGPDFDEWGRAGHDFWLTRNGHGAGFWDGDWPEPFAKQLSDATHRFGECYLYVGDDAHLYFS